MRVVAASDSTARSASTFCMSGCSATALPKVVRWAAWWAAAVTPWRMPAAAPMRQSRRVMLTISMMVRTPRPSSPTRQAWAWWYSTSDEALDLLPSLSFSRMSRSGLSVPSGRTRGTRKQVRPPGACARVRNTSDIGAEVNHLWPTRRYVPSACGAAAVVLARTSEPPCFSVIDMPAMSPRLPSGARSPKSYSSDVSSGSYCAARSGCRRRAGMAAYVIETGQPCPASTRQV